jgi:hypothetical protein
MNLNENPAQQQLRDLLAGHDDTAGHHVLWVDSNGEVNITTLPRGWPPVEFQPASAEVKLRYETFLAGNGYVGPEAAEDKEWVGELFDRLSKEWSKAKERSELQLITIE